MKFLNNTLPAFFRDLADILYDSLGINNFFVAQGFLFLYLATQCALLYLRVRFGGSIDWVEIFSVIIIAFVMVSGVISIGNHERDMFDCRMQREVPPGYLWWLGVIFGCMFLTHAMGTLYLAMMMRKTQEWLVVDGVATIGRCSLAIGFLLGGCRPSRYIHTEKEG